MPMTVRPPFTPELLALFQHIENCFMVCDLVDMERIVYYTALVVKSQQPKVRPRKAVYFLKDSEGTKVAISIDRYKPLWERAPIEPKIVIIPDPIRPSGSD